MSLRSGRFRGKRDRDRNRDRRNSRYGGMKELIMKIRLIRMDRRRHR